MPIARFQMSDGRVARFEVAEGTTPEQAQAVFDEWSASQTQAKPAAPAKPPVEEKGFFSNALEGVKTTLSGLPIGMGQTMLAAGKTKETPSQGLLDTLGRVFTSANPARLGAQLVTEPLRRQGVDKVVQSAAKRNVQQASDLAKKPGGMIGQVVGGLMTAPLMPAANGAKAAALTGAMFGGIQPVANESDRLTNVSAGAVGGVVGDAIGKQIAKVGVKGYQAAKQALTPAKKAVEAEVLPPQAVEQVRVYLMRQGIDFDKLSSAAKQDALRTVAKALDTNVEGNANAAARQAVLNSLPRPVQGTKGQLTQDFAQMRNEQMLADSGSAELRGLMDDQQRAIAENIDIARRGMGGGELTKEDAGRKARGVFNRLYEAEKAKTKELYNRADELEGKTPVTASKSLLNYLNENSGFEGIGAVAQKAKALGILATNKNGALVAKPVEARKLYELRRTLSDVQAGGGTAGKMAGDLKTMVDEVFDQAGPMYKQAAAQRRQQAVKFELPDVLQKVYGSKKGGADPKVADENLIRALQTSSINDIRTLKKTLLLNPKAVNPREAAGLWQDMRQQMLDDITEKSVIRDGQLTKINYQTLKNNLAKIGDERLRLVLGPKAANELKKIEAAARILFKSPESKTPGSATAANLMLRLNGITDMLERVPMPAGARMVIGGAKAAQKAAKREIDAADAMKPIDRQIDRDLRQRQLELVMQSAPVGTARRLMGQLSAIAASVGKEGSNLSDNPPEED